MTSVDLQAWMTAHSAGQCAVADYLGVSQSCVRRWLKGERHIPHAVDLALRAWKEEKREETPTTAKPV